MVQGSWRIKSMATDRQCEGHVVEKRFHCKAREWQWNGNGMVIEWQWHGNAMVSEWQWDGNVMAGALNYYMNREASYSQRQEYMIH